MPNDPYYRSKQWRERRAYVLERDRYTCVVRGCGQPATYVDHIVSRRHGGSDHPSNLRSLCQFHDGQVKEMPNGGQRRNAGELRVIGCDAKGWPLDPLHPWNQRRG
jgi:5-methylcytosine-specific restriction enzyme A